MLPECSKPRSAKITEVKGSCKGLVLIVGLTRSCRSWVKAPPGLQRLGHLLWLAELEDAGFLWHNRAFMLRCKLGHQLGLQPASLLGVQVAHLFGNIHQGVNLLLVALLSAFLHNTASPTDLHWKLLTACVPHKLSRVLLYVPALGITSTPFLTHLVVQDDSYSVLHCCGP